MMRPSSPNCEAALASLPAQLLVGVSGGLDSMALLQALVAVGHKPVVVHFDHGWRRESGEDARFVRDWAKKLGLKFVAGKMSSRTPRREASARAARYAFFADTARKLEIADLALAHQADDQVETFLLQLLRGGGAGARGMEERHGVPGWCCIAHGWGCGGRKSGRMRRSGS